MYIILIILGLLYTTYAQSLESLIDLSLKQNPMIKSFNYQIKSMQNKAESVNYLPDPTFQTTYFAEEIITANGAQTAQFSFMQHFPWFGTIGIKSAIIDKNSASYREKKHLFKLNLITNIKLNYYTLASVQEKAKIFKQYLYLLDGFYKSTLSRYENGQGLQQDILKIQTEIASVQHKKLLLSSKSARLLSNLRHYTFSELESVNARFQQIQTTYQSELIAVNNSHRIKLLIKEKEKLALKQNLVSKKTLPKFSFGLKYNVIDEKLGVSGNKDAYGVSFGVSLPIWSGKYSDEEESYINESFAVDQKILNESKQIEESLNYLTFDIKEKQASLDLYKNDLIPKAEMVLSASITAYETGKVNFLNLLDAQRMLMSLNLQYADTKKMLHLSISEFEKETTVFNK